MLCVPVSLDELLLLFAGCFSRPTFRTFRALVVGQISQTGLRTVTGMLIGARLSRVWHHARAHRFFSHARWSVDELGLRLAELIVERLCEPGAAVLVAVDDTLLHRLGRKIHGTYWHHDATANSDKHTSAWGNNFVVIGIVVQLPMLDRAVCLPVLFRLWRPRRPEYANARKPDPQRPGKPELAREMTDLLAARITTRTIDTVGDSAYATAASRRETRATREVGQAAGNTRSDRDRHHDQVDAGDSPLLPANRDGDAAHDRLPVGAARRRNPSARDPHQRRREDLRLSDRSDHHRPHLNGRTDR